jgi:Smg protein
MFDVVMFLIENYTDNGVSLITDKEAVTAELERVGFHKMEIDRALDWLDGLDRVQKAAADASPQLTGLSIRHYLPYEEERISMAGIGFLAYLEQLGILDARSREVVIDRLMALDKHEVDVARIQWVVLVALFNQPEKKPALSILQDLILSDAFGQLH